jgi:AcrR family transcriptional regulator
LSAARVILAESGYVPLTMDAVAIRAGVAKTTVYRRWTTKRDLVVAAVAEPFGALVEEARHEADPVDVLAQVAEVLDRPAIRTAFLALVSESWRDPSLRRRVEELLLRPALEAVRAQVTSVVGGVTSEEELQLVDDLVLGALEHRLLVSGRAVDRDYLARLVAAVTRSLTP